MVTPPQHDEAERREQGHVGIRALLVEHSGTKVEPHAYELGARRTNDTNATGDRPIRETSGDLERHTLNRGGTRTTDPLTSKRASPLGGARQWGAHNRKQNP
jgi:hypothetical protein